jgi:multiple sugar transport system ATP-binding protein
VGHPFRHAKARLLPHPRSREADPPATARTEYGFYPVYDPELSPAPPAGADLVVRVPALGLPREGESMTLAVDLDRLLLFDRAGDRIRV